MDQMHPNGNATLVAGGTIAKGQAVKIVDGKAVACTAKTDKAIGVALDGVSASGEILPVAIRGAFNGTCGVQVAAEVTYGDKLTATGTIAGDGDDVVAMAFGNGTSGNIVECALAL